MDVLFYILKIFSKYVLVVQLATQLLPTVC